MRQTIVAKQTRQPRPDKAETVSAVAHFMPKAEKRSRTNRIMYPESCGFQSNKNKVENVPVLLRIAASYVTTKRATHGGIKEERPALTQE